MWVSSEEMSVGCVRVNSVEPRGGVARVGAIMRDRVKREVTVSVGQVGVGASAGASVFGV